MKTLNFWRTLFLSMLAVTAFVACTDDDEEEFTGIPEITVNGAADASVAHDLSEGYTDVVKVVSSGPWTLAFENEGDKTWCTPSVNAGNGGETELKFYLAAASEARQTVVKLTANGELMGYPIPRTATITIMQGEGLSDYTLIYNETFGTSTAAADSKPYVEQYTAWNTTGEGAADVTYVGTNASVRNSSPNKTSSYDGASGAPILFFGKAPATFTVQNITLTPEQTNLKLTFGGQQTINYDTKDYNWSNDNLLVALSADGQTWTNITYEKVGGDDQTAPNWVLLGADFTLKEAASKLYIRFTTANLSSNIRIDDITLATGIGGQEVDLAAGGGDTPTPPTPVDAIYNETFGTAKVASNTEVADYTAWTKSGSGAAEVTYLGTNAQVRNSNPNNAESYEGASGVPLLFFRSAPATFTVQNITLTAEQTKLKLTFGGQQTINYDTKDYNWSNDNLSVALSADGQTWTDITYEKIGGDDKTDPYWVLLGADFTLKEAASKLYIRFTTANLSSAIRIDDITLNVGEGGQEVDLAAGGDTPAPTEATIGEIKTAGDYKTTGTVVARGKMAYIIADETGAMMVYHNNERTVGDKITIEGAVTIYNATSTPQFSDAATVTVVSTGNSWTYNPEVLDAAGMDALLKAEPVCKEMQFEGVLSLTGDNNKYANVTIAGAATAIGSIKYIDNATIESLNGKNIVVKGYFIGTSSSKYVNVLPYSVEEAQSTPAEPAITAVNPEALTWAAAETDAKTINVTGVKLAGNLTAELSGENADKWGAPVVAADGATVTIAPAAANESDVDYTATLTLTAGTTSKTVALTQSKPASQGGGEELTTYTWTLASGQIKQAGGTIAGVGEPAMDWTSTAATYIGWDSNNGRGVQVGSGNKPEAKFELSTSNFSGKIASIVVNSTTGGNGKLSVFVGGTQIGETVSLTKTSTDYTFNLNTPAEGEIKIVLEATTKAMYIKSVGINTAK